MHIRRTLREAWNVFTGLFAADKRSTTKTQVLYTYEMTLGTAQAPVIKITFLIVSKTR